MNLPSEKKLSYLKENQNLIGILNPYNNTEKLKMLTAKKVNCFSLELLPRITRAQSMDILSSQANLAGYKAVLEAFANFEKAIPMMMTAAGTSSGWQKFFSWSRSSRIASNCNSKRMGAIVLQQM